MRVAIQNSLPNYPIVAETELIRRCVLALWNIGWEVAEVVTSDDIRRFRPDWVLATHFSSPKLTSCPTLGAMFNPPEFYRDNPEHMRNILSYDGYLTVSLSIRDYLENLLSSLRKKKPISDFLFLPTTHQTEFAERPAGPCRLFYIGVHWTGRARHGPLFELLSRTVPMDVYGPPDNWKGEECNYRGQLRPDGRTVLARMRESGVALCIHSKEHQTWNAPSMRVFEAAAAGAVILADDLPIIRQQFGDAILPVDMGQPVAKIVRQIAKHMDWIDENPDQAAAMARKAHAIFCEKFCLERMFERIPAFVDQVRRANGYLTSDCGAQEPSTRPTVEYVVPCLAGQLGSIEQRLRMLREQSYQNIGVIVAHAADEGQPDAILEKHRDDFVSVKVVTAPGSVRRNALLAGLRAVTAPFFAVLNDDHRFHPNHVASLMEILEGSRALRLAQAGVIEVSGDAGPYFDQWNFHGPLGQCIPETRRLATPPLGNSECARDLEFTTLCSWIACSDLLDDDVYEDPDLPGANLLPMLLEKAKPGCSVRPTCEVRVGPDRVSKAVKQAGDRLTPATLPAYALDTPESLVLRFLREVPLAAAIGYDPCGPEAFVLRRLSLAYFAARAVAKVLVRPWRLPRLTYVGLRVLAAYGPRKFLSRLAGAGHRL